MTRDDYLMILVALGCLSVAVLIQSAEIARIREDVAFTRLAASAAFTESEREP